MLPLNTTLHWIFFMDKVYLNFLSSIKNRKANMKKKVLSKYENIFELSRMCKQIFEYIWWSENLRMSIRIYWYWGKGTHINRNNIQVPYYSNIQTLEYLCSYFSLITPIYKMKLSRYKYSSIGN